MNEAGEALGKPRKAIAGLLLAAAILSRAAGPAWGDGMMLSLADPRQGRWDLHDERDQQAYIEFRDGIERLTIGVGLNVGDRGVLWIFPVPSSPEGVRIDIAGGLPAWGGEEVVSGAKAAAWESVAPIRLLQPQLLPFNAPIGRIFFGILELPFFGLGALDADMEARPGPPSPEIPRLDVMVHARVEKMGLAAEVLTAKTSAGLYKYLSRRGLKDRPASIRVFDRYIGGGYSFIASWITAPGDGGRRSVAASFPARRIFYPLIPTSVYGERIVPAAIRISGFRTPALPRGLRDASAVEYFVGDRAYTKITIKAASKLFVEDLWIEPGAPFEPRYFSFIHGTLHRRPIAAALLLLVASTLASGLALGPMIFKAWRNKPGLLKAGALSLANIATGLGLIFVVSLLKTRELDAAQAAEVDGLKVRGRWARAGALAWAYQSLDPRKLHYLFWFPPAVLLCSQLMALGLVGIPAPARGPASAAPRMVFLLLGLWWAACSRIYISGASGGRARVKRGAVAAAAAGALMYAALLIWRVTAHPIIISLENWGMELPFLVTAASRGTGADAILLIGLIAAALLWPAPAALALSFVAEEDEPAWLKTALGGLVVGGVLEFFRATDSIGGQSAAAILIACSLLVLACLAGRRLHEAAGGPAWPAWKGGLAAGAGCVALLGMFYAAAQAAVPRPDWPLERLSRALRSADLAAGIGAAEVLRRRGRDGAATLAGALEDGPPQMNPVFRRALVGIGSDSADVLIDSLQAESPQIREAALRVLGELGPGARDALPAMLRAASEDLDPGVRAVALGALAALPFYDPEFIGKSGAPGEAALQNAKARLSPDFDAQVESALSRGLTDPDRQVRSTAVGLSSRIGVRAAVALLLRAYQDESVGSGAGYALDRLAAGKQEEFRAGLMRGLGQEASRPAAIAFLKRLGPVAKEAAPPLAHIFKTGKDARIRLACLEALWAVDRGAAAALLPAALEDAGPSIRGKALELFPDAVEAFGAPKAARLVTKSLIRALRRQESRLGAILALSRIGGPAKAALPVLIEVFRAEADQRTRGAILDALAFIDPQGGAEAFILALGDEDYYLRRNAVLYLFVAQVPPDRAVPLLVPIALGDKEAMVRGAATRILGMAPYQGPAFSRLARILGESHPEEVLLRIPGVLAAIDARAAASSLGAADGPGKSKRLRAEIQQALRDARLNREEAASKEVEFQKLTQSIRPTKWKSPR